MMVNNQEPNFNRILFAGIAAQTAENITLGHVCNRIAVEQQSKPHLTSIIGAIKSIIQRGGIRELSTGLRWNLMAGSAKGTTRWLNYNGGYRLWEKNLSPEFQKKYPLIVAALAGSTSAFIGTTLVFCPLENLKIREMTGNKALWQTIKKEGLSFFYNGYKWMLIKQTGSLGTYLIAYEKLQQWITGGKPAPLYKKIGISVLAGIVSCGIHTPLDMLRTQEMMENRTAPKKMLQEAKEIRRKYGIRGFYVGLPVKLIRSGWHAGVTLGIMGYFNALPKQMDLG